MNLKIALLVLILSSSFVLGQSVEPEELKSQVNPDKERGLLSKIFSLHGFDVVIWASVISGFFIIVSVLIKDKVPRRQQQYLFAAISIPILLATAYLVVDTLYLNVISESKGPVHWHADYQVWVCGEDITKDQKYSDVWWDNKVGTPILHSHEEHKDTPRTRIHVEGTLKRLSDASLQSYFRVIDGDYFEAADGSTHIIIPLSAEENEATKVVRDGDLCPNGKPGEWTLYVEGGEEDNRSIRVEESGPSYVMAPHTRVPPGDRFYLVFDSEDHESKIETGSPGVQPHNGGGE